MGRLCCLVVNAWSGTSDVLKINLPREKIQLPRGKKHQQIIGVMHVIILMIKKNLKGAENILTKECVWEWFLHSRTAVLCQTFVALLTGNIYPSYNMHLKYKNNRQQEIRGIGWNTSPKNVLAATCLSPESKASMHLFFRTTFHSYANQKATASQIIKDSLLNWATADFKELNVSHTNTRLGLELKDTEDCASQTLSPGGPGTSDMCQEPVSYLCPINTSTSFLEIRQGLTSNSSRTDICPQTTLWIALA